MPPAPRATPIRRTNTRLRMNFIKASPREAILSHTDAEQLRPDTESGTLGGLGVDLELQAAVDDNEAHHAALAEEEGGIADREDWSVHAVKERRRVAIRVLADEDNLTAVGVVTGRHVSRDELASSDAFAAGPALERIEDLRAAEDADHEWLIRRRRRPAHEDREVEEKAC